MSHKFKAGDRVIVLNVRQKIEFDYLYKNIDKHNSDTVTYPFVVDDAFVTECGRLHPSNPNPYILPASAENVKAVNQLYPSANLTVPKTPNDIARAMFKRGYSFVLAYVSEISFDNARNNKCPAILCHLDSDDGETMRDSCSHSWGYVVPINPKTGLEVIEIWDTSNDS